MRPTVQQDPPQLSLFQEVFWSGASHEHEKIAPSVPATPAITDAHFSELVLHGQAVTCLMLLAPVLRTLSEEQDGRWLTLIAPPSSLTHDWLRKAGLNREGILLLSARDETGALALACETLRRGHSHTVISWLPALGTSARQRLATAAQAGQAQSLNIRLG
ncbi:MAG: Cell division inhibitor SulA [Pseudomonas delhiensis]|nr:MAG: Cell division inhibitor SulA [Pseudomonas delhiensis]